PQRSFSWFCSSGFPGVPVIEPFRLLLDAGEAFEFRSAAWAELIFLSESSMILTDLRQTKMRTKTPTNLTFYPPSRNNETRSWYAPRAVSPVGRRGLPL